MTFAPIIVLLLAILLLMRSKKLSGSKAVTMHRMGLGFAVLAFGLAVLGAFDIGQDHAENDSAAPGRRDGE